MIVKRMVNHNIDNRYFSVIKQMNSPAVNKISLTTAAIKIKRHCRCCLRFGKQKQFGKTIIRFTLVKVKHFISQFTKSLPKLLTKKLNVSIPLVNKIIRSIFILPPLLIKYDQMPSVTKRVFRFYNQNTLFLILFILPYGKSISEYSFGGSAVVESLTNLRTACAAFGIAIFVPTPATQPPGQPIPSIRQPSFYRPSP